MSLDAAARAITEMRRQGTTAEDAASALLLIFPGLADLLRARLYPGLERDRDAVRRLEQLERGIRGIAPASALLDHDEVRYEEPEMVVRSDHWNPPTSHMLHALFAGASLVERLRDVLALRIAYRGQLWEHRVPLVYMTRGALDVPSFREEPLARAVQVMLEKVRRG